MQLYMIPANCSVGSDRLPHKKYSVGNDEIWQVLLADFKVSRSTPNKDLISSINLELITLQQSDYYT